MTPQQILGMRRELGLTRRRLAQVLGVDRSSVSRWETGARVISAPTEKLLAHLVDLRRQIRREA